MEFTFSRGKISPGVFDKDGLVCLGEDGRGRQLRRVQKRELQLHANETLLRVSTEWVYTRDTYGRVGALSGEPSLLAKGNGAHGDAGRIGGWEDTLWAVSPGDILEIVPEGGNKTVVYVAVCHPDGSVTTGPRRLFAEADALDNPERWAKVFGYRPVCMPADYVGKRVAVIGYARRGHSDERYGVAAVGECTSASPLAVRIGTTDMAFRAAIFVRLARENEEGCYQFNPS